MALPPLVRRPDYEKTLNLARILAQTRYRTAMGSPPGGFTPSGHHAKIDRAVRALLALKRSVARTGASTRPSPT